jgi:alpha-galactosidase
MMSAPLILGNDIRKFVDGNNQPVEGNSVLKIVTNKHLIAIDRDSLCKSAKRIKKTAFFDIIAKPLSNGDTALCILNKSSSSKTASFDLNELCGDEYLSFKQAEEYELHELWSDERINATKINTAIAPHGVKVYRIKTL